MKKKTDTIELIPLWEGIMPALWTSAARGNQDAQCELLRLARLVDHQNRKNKEARKEEQS